jgi:4-amino-4-deoxy-L-arabinose transferase-like glycosyltransferase
VRRGCRWGLLDEVSMTKAKGCKPMWFLKKENKNLLLISMIFLIAISARIWGISYDLPYIYHPDEPWPIRIAHHMLGTGDLNPHFFDWSSFVLYTNLFVQAVYYSIDKLLGFREISTISNPLVEITMGVTYTSEPMLVILGRCVTMLFGIGTIAAIIRAGRELSTTLQAGMAAGLMMAVSPTSVSLNRFITPDTFATFFLTMTFLASIFIFRQGKTWSYILAGICMGLAVSSKYNSGLIVIVIFAGHFLRTGLSGYKDHRLFLALFISILAFIAATPFALLDFPKFYADFLSTGQHYSTGHPGMEGDPLTWYLSYAWRSGGIFYIFAVLEMSFGIYSRSKETILLSIFPVTYFLFISNFIVRNDRTFLPVTPFLFLLAALFLIRLWNISSNLQQKVSRQLFTILLICLFITGLFQSSLKTITDTIQLTTVDSRETARVWIDNNVQAGDKIMVESYSPFVDPARFSVQGVGRIIEHEPQWYIDQEIDYLVFSEGMFGRFYDKSGRYEYETSKYDLFFSRFQLVKIFTDGGYEVRIYKVK